MPWDLVPPCEQGDWLISTTPVGDWTPAADCTAGDWGWAVGAGGILLEDGSGHWLLEAGAGGWLFG